jgi:5-methylcytosine-specific restriction endonuclease McrA
MKKRNKQTGCFERTGEKVKCFHCGKELYRPFWRLKRNKHQFCSRSCEAKVRIGKLAPNYQGGEILKTCPTCKTEFKVRRYKKNRICYCSKKCINYIHGKGYQGYSSEFRKSRYKILNRDFYICQLCGKHEMECQLHIHHIDYNKNNNDRNNLITLCCKCNIKANNSRNYWKRYFQNIVLDNYRKKDLVSSFLHNR